MANITKISVNGEVYDINPAWVDVTDGGLVLNADKVRGMTVRGKVTDPVDDVDCSGFVLDGGFGKLTLAYNAYEHKLNIFDADGWRISIPLTNSHSSDTSGTSGTSSPATDTSSTTAAPIDSSSTSTTSSTTTPAP